MCYVGEVASYYWKADPLLLVPKPLLMPRDSATGLASSARPSSLNLGPGTDSATQPPTSSSIFMPAVASSSSYAAWLLEEGSEWRDALRRSLAQAFENQKKHRYEPIEESDSRRVPMTSSPLPGRGRNRSWGGTGPAAARRRPLSAGASRSYSPVMRPEDLQQAQTDEYIVSE